MIKEQNMTTTALLSEATAQGIIQGNIELYSVVVDMYDESEVSPSDVSRIQVLLDETCRDCGYHPDDDMEKAIDQLWCRIEDGLR